VVFDFDFAFDLVRTSRDEGPVQLTWLAFSLATSEFLTPPSHLA